MDLDGVRQGNGSKEAGTKRDRPDLSIVIVTHESEEYLPRCVQSVYRATQGISFEIIMVDNASKDNLVELARAEFPEVKIIENKRNEGFAHGVNQGVSIASGRVLTILNPDTQLYPDTLKVLLDFLDRHPSDCVVGARTVDEMGRSVPSCRSLPHIGNILKYPISFLLRGRRLKNPNRFLLDLWDQNKTVDLMEYNGYVTGACLVTRLDFFREMGGFDERYFLYCEDADFCSHMRRSGHHAFLISEASVIHWGGRSASRNPLTRLYFVEAYLHYIHKNLTFVHGLAYQAGLFFLVVVWTLKAWVRRDRTEAKILLQSLRCFNPA